MADNLSIINTAQIQFRNNPPECLLVQTSTVTAMASGISWTSIAFSDSAGVVLDNYGGHSTSTNPSRYTIQVPGYYTISGTVTFAANATGLRGVRIAKNGTEQRGFCTIIGAAPTGLGMCVPLPARNLQCAVGDYIEIQGLQNSGGSLNTSIGTDLAPGLWIRWDHP